MILSVIVPILGSSEKLSRFFDGVLTQKLDRNKFELIVVDDGSIPSLVTTFNIFKKNFTNGKAIFIRHEINQGRAKARNSGILRATGDVILFVDVDNIPMAHTFGQILECFLDGELKAVRGNVRCRYDSINKSAYTKFFDSRYLGARGVPSGPLLYRYFASDALAISRLALDRVGYFDENFLAYGCEDEELGCRVRSGNIPFCFDSDANFEDTDEPTIRREAKRMYDYSRYSIPILLNKHPEYCSQCIFPQLESAINLKQKMKRFLYLFVLNKPLATLMMKFLEYFDSKFDEIPSVFYYYVIASYYAEGYKKRPVQ